MKLHRHSFVAICIIFVCVSLVSAAPAYNDYESLGDLYELLLQKEAFEDQLGHPHEIVRKSNRMPTLRLRFGKRMNPYVQNFRYNPHPLHLYDDASEN